MNALRPSAPLLSVSLAALALLLSGCGATHVSTAANPGTALTGRLLGGQQAVVGSSIQLYAAGATGNGSNASALLTPPVLSGTDGGFSITGDYTCPSSTTQVYIVARGGNPGLPGNVNNAALVMMAALGDCGNLTPSSFVTINEVTTAASAWALAQFTGVSAKIGASSTNATGLRNAFLVANNLVNTTTGAAGGTNLPVGATLEPSKLYTLADVLAACINSTGGAACTPLFSAATNNGAVPANTLDAALAIVRNPTRNVAAVFNAASAQGPFQPTLAAAPNDWTMSLDYTGGGLFEPSAIGIDSTGAVWAANFEGGHASKFSAAGISAAPNGFPDPALNESYGIAIDGQDSAWVTIMESFGVNSGYGAISKFSSTGTVLSGSGFYAGGVYYPYAIAADSNGNMWVADNGRSGASLLANDGSAISGPTGYQPAGLAFPLAVALDNNHTAWFAAQYNAVSIAPGGAANVYTCCRFPAGISLDPAANVWVADYMASALVEVTPAGFVAQTLTGGGLHNPESVITDSSGNIWVTNFRGNTITDYSAPSLGISTTISANGLGVDAGLNQPFGIAIDASGNVWVSNLSGNSLTEFVGLAAPTKTPRLGLPAAP